MTEVLVAIGVLGILMAILIPAVQQSRGTARRIECSNHMRQIGLATQQYVDVYGVLPGADGSPLFQLFPFLELQSWFVEDGNLHLGKRHPILLCPLDGLHDASQSPFSYLITGGGCIGCGEGMVRLGALNKPGIRWSEITDGVSLTALFSERRASVHYHPTMTAGEIGAMCKTDPVRCTWRLGRVFGLQDDAAFVNECRDPTRRLGADAPFDERVYSQNGGRPYSHVLPPNIPSCYRGFPTETSHPLGATSHHNGGVNLLLCDGAVRFVSDSVGLPTWWALGTRNGNDVVNEF